MQPHRRQPTRLPRPWDSPGKNTRVGCHFLLQCVNVKGESEVAQSCLTLLGPMDCSPPGSSVHGILQARTLERIAIAFSAYPPRSSQSPELSPLCFSAGPCQLSILQMGVYICRSNLPIFPTPLSPLHVHKSFLFPESLYNLSPSLFPSLSPSYKYCTQVDNIGKANVTPQIFHLDLRQ